MSSTGADTVAPRPTGRPAQGLGLLLALLCALLMPGSADSARSAKDAGYIVPSCSAPALGDWQEVGEDEWMRVLSVEHHEAARCPLDASLVRWVVIVELQNRAPEPREVQRQSVSLYGDLESGARCVEGEHLHELVALDPGQVVRWEYSFGLSPEAVPLRATYHSDDWPFCFYLQSP